MDNLRIPLNPTWFQVSSWLATPENGILYTSVNKSTLVHIPPLEENASPDVQQFYLKNSVKVIKAIDCDPDWSETKYVAILGEGNIVYIYDLNTKLIMRGHRYHMYSSDKKTTTVDPPGSICFTANHKLISIAGADIVKYCVASNTCTVISNLLLLKKHVVNILKVSPYDENMLAIGTKKGLVLIVNLTDMQIVYTLRGHDTEITSLDWMQINLQEEIQKPTERPQLQAKSRNRRKPVPIIDHNDVFDIYDFDDTADEFGAQSRAVLPKAEVEEKEFRIPISCNESLDFVEACQNLKEDILAVAKEEASETFDATTLDETIDQTEVLTPMSPIATLQESSDDFESVDNPDVTRNCDLSDADDDFVKPNHEDVIDYHVYLASGAKESILWIWDAANGVGVHKIELPKCSKSAIPSTYTVFCWLTQNQIVTNTPKGDLAMYELKFSSQNKITSNIKKMDCSDKAVIGICKLPGTSTPTIWSNSMYQQIICTEFNETPKVLVKYGTMGTTNYAIQECPHDFNKIAVGGSHNRIRLLDVSSLKNNNIEMTNHSNKIQAKVLCLSWHPVHENILAFSTEEGRVGILDTNKQSNVPIVMKPFSGKPVYQISWGCVSYGNDSRYVLFACSAGKLVYFPESGEGKHAPIHFKEEVLISAVSAGKHFLALGSTNGYALLYTLDLKNMFWNKKIAVKYITECAWSPVKPRKLAVCTSDSGIFLYNCESETTVIELGPLEGHKGVTMAKWSNETEHRLVSSGFDNTIRVWNTESMQCISLYLYSGNMFAATFLPSNEDFILACGQTETIHMFDSKKHMHELTTSTKSKKCDFVENIKWATQLQTTQKLIAKEKKKNKKIEKKNLDHLADSLSEVTIDDVKNEAVIAAAPVLKLNYTTILHLASKEYIREWSNCITELCTDETKTHLNSLIFSSKEDVKDYLNRELQNHKDSNTESIGHVLIPQLTFDFKETVLEKIKTKSLTEQYVAIAPWISYDFWKHCAKAYAMQSIELGCTLQAIPYLLATHNPDEAIERLCKSDHYREAWIIAKIYKLEGDKMFDTISMKWISYLDANGNLECAAVVAVSVKKYDMALEILQKRKNKTAEIERIIELLKIKLE